MYFSAGLRTGDGHLPFPQPSKHSICGYGQFQRDLRPTLGLPRQVAGHGAPGFLLQDADRDLDIGVGQDFQTATRDTRIGIGDGNHDAGDARCDDRIGAGRRLSMMRARFERDIGRGSPRLLACFGNGLGFCMGTTA